MSSASSAEIARGGPRSGSSPTLVVGLGNPLLGDDGVGWRVIEALEERLAGCRGASPSVPVELDRLAVGGLALMERLVGYERVVLVDAVLTRRDLPGTVSCLPFTSVATRDASHLDSAHDAPLPVALAAGRALGAELPADITVVGIEARRVDVFDEELSPEVAAAVPVAVGAVLALMASPGPQG